jgi:two-component system, OmpR family, sensor histidine kinase MprB
MSFRRRITLTSAAAVAVAVVLASALIYVLTSNQLHSQVDAQLHNRGRGFRALASLLAVSPPSSVQHGRHPSITLPDGVRLPLSKRALALAGRDLPTQARANVAGGLFGREPPAPGQVRGYQQLIDSTGRVLQRSNPNVPLPVDAATVELAARGGPPLLSDAHVAGLHLRVLAESLGSGHVLQVAQPLTEVDRLLARLRLILVLIDAGGIALAALLGALVAGAAVAPLSRLTRATEHVGRTRDLSGRIEQTGNDEIGRLAASFNAMLDALESSINALDASVHAQRQLVADASHELRTPVTSLRTNIELLQQQGGMMSPAEREQLLGEVVEQIEDLTLLMNDLIELARGEEPRAETEDVRLDLLVRDVLERTGRHSPATPFDQQLAPTILPCVPARMERAVANLLDNAIKHSPPGTAVNVELRGNELMVRDHGAGIAPEDLPHVFDRFYRGADARGRPGSGLGLAIVRQVCDQLGGSISAEEATGGGTLMRMSLPGAEPVPAEDTVAPASERSPA